MGSLNPFQKNPFEKGDLIKTPDIGEQG